MAYPTLPKLYRNTDVYNLVQSFYVREPSGWHDYICQSIHDSDDINNIVEMIPETHPNESKVIDTFFESFSNVRDQDMSNLMMLVFDRSIFMQGEYNYFISIN